jgi:5-oxoprolinase (ATP-hydrolysing) subunit A
VAAASASYDTALPLLGLPSSALAEAAQQAGVPFVAEAFADRAYTPSGRLVPRTSPGAVHADEATVVEQAVRLVRDGLVTATDGTSVAVSAASVCLHGDTAGAVSLARSVRAALEELGAELAPFAP